MSRAARREVAAAAADSSDEEPLSTRYSSRRSNAAAAGSSVAPVAGRRAAPAVSIDDDEDEGGGGRRRRRGQASAAAASSTTPASAAAVAPAASGTTGGSLDRTHELFGSNARSRDDVDESSPDPPEQQRRSKRSKREAVEMEASPASPLKLRSRPDTPQSLSAQEAALHSARDDDLAGFSSAVPPSSVDPAQVAAENEAAQWDWVTAKLFRQSPSLSRRWSEAGLVLPPRGERDLDSLREAQELLRGKRGSRLVRMGVPMHLRPAVWEILSGVAVYGGRLETPLNYYPTLVRQAYTLPAKLRRDIRADIPRTLQEHARFKTKAAHEQLERILCAYAVRNPAVGYCQSMSHLAGFLMLFYPSEESVFWLLVTLLDSILPSEFYAPSLLGVRVEAEVFLSLVSERCGRLARHLKRHDVDLRVLALRWFLTLFLGTLPLETAARVWDLLFLVGSSALSSAALALLELHREEILAAEDAGELTALLHNLGSDLHHHDSADALLIQAAEFEVLPPEVRRRRDKLRPALEREYVHQLQTMESRRHLDERERLASESRAAAELVRLRDFLAAGTEVTKVPRTAFTWKGWFSAHARPKRIRIRVRKVESDEAAATNGNGRPKPSPAPVGSPQRSPKPGASLGLAPGLETDASGFLPLRDQTLNRGPDGDDLEPRSPRSDRAAQAAREEWMLEWEGSVKKDAALCRLPLREVQLVLGCSAGVFASNPAARSSYGSRDYLCASFLFHPDAARRLALPDAGNSLDVVFDRCGQVATWLRALRQTSILSIRLAATNKPSEEELKAEEQQADDQSPQGTVSSANTAAGGKSKQLQSAQTSAYSSSSAAGGTGGATSSAAPNGKLPPPSLAPSPSPGASREPSVGNRDPPPSSRPRALQPERSPPPEEEEAELLDLGPRRRRKRDSQTAASTATSAPAAASAAAADEEAPAKPRRKKKAQVEDDDW